MLKCCMWGVLVDYERWMESLIYLPLHLDDMWSNDEDMKV